MNIPYLILPVLVGLICGIVGYILGKKSLKNEDSLASILQDDLDASKATAKNLSRRISSLENDLLEAKAKKKKKSFATAESVAFFDSSTAADVCGKAIKENDLKIVEGIGPKIEFLLKHAGISTWKDLSETETEKLQSIIDAGGENYAIHNPSTWSKQALFAYEGKWIELKDWQDSLQAGKE